MMATGLRVALLVSLVASAQGAAEATVTNTNHGYLKVVGNGATTANAGTTTLEVVKSTAGTETNLIAATTNDDGATEGDLFKVDVAGNVDTAGVFKKGGTQLVGAQGVGVADASNTATTTTDGASPCALK